MSLEGSSVGLEEREGGRERDRERYARSFPQSGEAGTTRARAHSEAASCASRARPLARARRPSRNVRNLSRVSVTQSGERHFDRDRRTAIFASCIYNPRGPARPLTRHGSKKCAGSERRELIVAKSRSASGWEDRENALRTISRYLMEMRASRGIREKMRAS